MKGCFLLTGFAFGIILITTDILADMMESCRQRYAGSPWQMGYYSLRNGKVPAEISREKVSRNHTKQTVFVYHDFGYTER